MGSGQAGRFLHALEGDFQLQQQGVGVGDHGLVALDHGRGEGAIGLGGDADAVLPFVAHIDDGDAGGQPFVQLDGAHIDAVFGEARLHLLADGVVADAGDEGDRGAEAGGGHRLIGALAAGNDLIAVAGQGFTGAGKVGDAQHMIRIHAAEDYETIHSYHPC